MPETTATDINAEVESIVLRGDVPAELDKHLISAVARWFLGSLGSLRRSLNAHHGESPDAEEVWADRHGKAWQQSLEAYVAEHREPLPWSTDPALAVELMKLFAQRGFGLIEVIYGMDSLEYIATPITATWRGGGFNDDSFALAVCRAAIAAARQESEQR